jgi:hypothetical protein
MSWTPRNLIWLVAILVAACSKQAAARAAARRR